MTKSVLAKKTVKHLPPGTVFYVSLIAERLKSMEMKFFE